MKKSGPTIDSFLKKMQQQMGVAIVGFAAYRDEEGRLCTFEYVTFLLSRPHFSYQSWPSLSFSTKDTREVTFTKAHAGDIDQFLGKWGKWVSQKGNNAGLFLFFPYTHLAILVLGVGSTKPNRGEDDEDGEPEEEADSWMKLLDLDNEILSLKSWKEVTALKANRGNIALALRAIIRQAWGESILFYCCFSHLSQLPRAIREKRKDYLGSNQLRSRIPD